MAKKENYDFTFAHREEGFDNHIEKSIRGYSHLLEDIINLSKYFIEDGTNVVDIGCSTGKVTEKLIEFNKGAGSYYGIELATGFFKELDARYDQIAKKFPNTNLKFIKDDVINYTFHNCSFVTSIFTLQFMPRKNRLKVIQDIYNGLNDGGAFLFAEKTISCSPRIQEMMTFNFYDYKSKHFTCDDILSKERTLRNMLKPNTWSELKAMLKEAGFTDVQMFWCNHLFVGALAIK